MDVQQFTELLGAIYAGTLETDGWQHALIALSAFFGCASSAMRIIDMDDFHVVFEVAAGTRDRDVAVYAEHFASVLPHLDMLKTASSHYASDVFVVGEHEVERLQFAGSPNGKLKTSRGARGFVFKVDSRIVHIAMRCDGDEAMAGEAFPQALTLLVPHLQRAFLIARRVTELKYRTDSLEQTMNCFSSGVILIDGRGAPVYLNRRAREVVTRMQGLSIVSGQLVGANIQSTQRLRRMAAAAVKQGKEGGDDIGAMSVQCHSDAHADLAIVAVPLHVDMQAMASNESGIHAALLIGSPSFAAELRPEILQLLANLTGAEARLALGLAAGRSLGQYCKEAGIQVSTARSYLKQIFQKTGTNRQTELVGLVRSIPIHM